ncbi:MAG: lipoprotein [Bacteroidales bacterium]|nr:lipoprotein [Bacteroidales bacterium]
MRKYVLFILAVALLSACTQEPEHETSAEEEALEFLYQSMPLGDSIDYTEGFYQECISYAYKAKAELPWGDSIPEREFRHFVLPPRVNNENLDRFRATYYEELKDRVQNLSLYDAVLEVNHWCHEHVNYKGSDSRTSAPMATVKTSWGRCGEESTLLVTALRTVGIPARQVYTPRWAHCDDNHAWVEAWVDGHWHFLGACEPEPVLDLGWFNEPASRALLLHTRVFGDYDGPEEVISRTPYYTEINVVDNYGETAKTTFTVKDIHGKPIPGITVEFKIYNYAEFCTVVRKTTDANGQTWLTAGLGCMMAYAAKDGMFGFQVFKPGEQEEVTLVLDHQEGSSDSFEFDMVPPAPTANIPEVSIEMRTRNNHRVSYEDSLRNTYNADCKEAQQRLIMNTGNKTLCRIYEKTWGNYQTIADFVQYAGERQQSIKAVNLLQQISDKDLRDISLEVLKDHFDHTPSLTSSVLSMPPELYDQYILNPRISNEMIVAWREPLTGFFSETDRQVYHDHPIFLVDWVRNNITVDDDLNPQRIPISPLGVLKILRADRHSRDICFVAMARSLGIAAQINPVNGNVQYSDKNQWINVDFEAVEPVNNAVGYLDLQYQPNRSIVDPKYYTHFSIKKFDGNRFRLLAYDAKDPGIDDGMTLSSFDHPTPLDEGYYILTSGTRLEDGTALTHSEFFTIKAGDTTMINLILRQPKVEMEVLGQLNVRPEFVEGSYILGYLDQGSEPTTHAMQDIATFRKEFEEIGIPMLFVFGDDEEYQKFFLKGFKDLPDNISPYIDEDGALWEELFESLQLNEKTLPVFVIVNERNEVVFLKQGYTIGLGEQLYQSLRATSFSV